MATEKEITKAQKQFEKEKDNLIQYAKEFKRFFTFSKRSPNFNIIYSSAISGFEKKPLYDTIKGKKHIMFVFETIRGEVFGCYNDLEIPNSTKHGSVSIDDDPHYFIFSLVPNKDCRHKPFSLSLVDNKEKKVEYVIKQETTIAESIMGIGGTVLNMGEKLVTGVIDGVVTGVQAGVNVVEKGIDVVAGTELSKDVRKEKKRMRSLYISSDVNQDWILETFCGFIISGNEVMFNRRMGNFYQVECAPEGLKIDDEEVVTRFIAEVKDCFVGKDQPKPVELKKMVVIQWVFDKKKD